MAVQFPTLQTMVMAFALIYAKTSAVDAVGLNDLTFSQVANVAPQAMTLGFSLAGTTVQDLAAPGVNVTCTIQMDNWTRFPLVYPYVQFKENCSKDALTTAPTEIMPGKIEAFAVQRPSASPSCGLEGAVSWKVPEVNRYLVIAWSITDFKYKWMAVGLSKRGVERRPDNPAWFDQAEKGDTTEVTFLVHHLHHWIYTFVSRSFKFEIVATTNNNNRAQIKAVFRPQNGFWQDLALPFKTLLRKRRPT